MSRNHTGASVTDNEEHVSLNGVNAKAIAAYGFDGSSLKPLSTNQSLKTQVVGAVTYVGTAAPGTLQATAAWRAMKIDQTGGATVVTWADGDSNFDNVATDLTALSYS